MAFIFAEKVQGLLNSTLVVRNNIVSYMEVEVGADTDEDNVQLQEDILVRPHVDVEEADYNLNSQGGLQAQNIIPDISNTSSINYDIPRLLEEDIYRKKRSQTAEGGNDSADAGAIEVNSLNDERSYIDPSEVGEARLTPQGRNMLARGSMGQASIQIIGFLLGRGGYVYHNPVETLPVNTLSDNARGWVEASSNIWTALDIIEIQGYQSYKTIFNPRLASESDNLFTHMYYFDVGDTITETITNLVGAINDNNELLATVYAQAENSRCSIVAVPTGTIGNTIWYSVTGSNLTSYYGVAPSEGVLIGGVDEDIDASMIDKIFNSVTDGGEMFTEFANDTALAITCKLGPTELNFALGEIGIIAEVKQSVFSGEVGTQYVHALAHQPLAVKHKSMIWVKRFIIIH